MKHPTSGGHEQPKIFLFAGTILVVALVVASVGLVALVLVLGLSRDHSELQEHNVPYAVAISTAALNAKAIANHERGFLISGRREFLVEIDQGLLEARNAFAEAAFTSEDDIQLRAAARAEAGFERWVAALQRELRTYRRGDRTTATQAALGPGRALRKDYEAALAQAQRVAVTAIELRRNSFASSGWIFIVLASLIVVLAIGLGTTVALVHLLRVPASDDGTAAPAAAPLNLVVPPADHTRRRQG
ncbi:MAG TPA: CHASE3 domain-containing protein [Gaiellaceae bacterium]